MRNVKGKRQQQGCKAEAKGKAAAMMKAMKVASSDSDGNGDTFVIQLRGQTDRRGGIQDDFIETQIIVLYTCKPYTMRSMSKSK